MDLIMDIIGDLLEGLFKCIAKSSFNSVGRKIKGEESDDRNVYETWDREENEEGQLEEIGIQWNEINYKNEEEYVNESNNESKVEHLDESNYSNKCKDLRSKSSLFNIYITGKSRTNRTKDFKNIESKDNKNIAPKDIEKNKKGDLLFNNSKDSDDNIIQSDNNQTSYDIKQNNNKINSGLEFNKYALRNAIVYSEILGKPKAKSRRRCKNWS